jgi:hypothetical protein
MLESIISLIYDAEIAIANPLLKPMVVIAKVPYGKLDEIDSQIIFRKEETPSITIIQADKSTGARFISGKIMNHDVLIEEYGGDSVQVFVNVKDLK